MFKRISIFVLAITAAAFGAIAISQAATTRVVHSAKHTHASRRARPIAASLDDHFAVLRSAKTAASSEALPAEYAKALTESGTMVSEFGLEPAHARVLDTGGTTVWVIPGRSGLCLGTPESDGVRATSCGSLEHADAEGVFIVQRPTSGAATVIGLVPNGDTISIASQSGSSNSVAVANNVFTYSDSSEQSVSVHAANGSVARTLTLSQ